MMLLTDARYRQCGGCGSRTRITSEVYGCDTCKKVIDPNKKVVEYLEATVHHKGDQAARIHCCNWRCMVKALRKVKTDYFVSMPFLHYDGSAKGLRAKDFFALLKRR